MSDFGKTLRIAENLGINKVRAANMRIRYLKPLEKTFRCYKYGKVWANDMKDEIEFLKRFSLMKPDPKREITDQDVEAARNYPINKLIDFNNGTAKAWCHDDHNPSLAHLTRINKARCYPCDKTFDSIQVMIDCHGMSFVDAVKFLSGG